MNSHSISFIFCNGWTSYYALQVDMYNHTGDRRCVQRIVLGRDLVERDHLEDLSLDRRIIFKWIFTELDRESWTGLILLSIGQLAGSCECYNEPSCYIKCGEFLDQLRTC